MTSEVFRLIFDAMLVPLVLWLVWLTMRSNENKEMIIVEREKMNHSVTDRKEIWERLNVIETETDKELKEIRKEIASLPDKIYDRINGKH